MPSTSARQRSLFRIARLPLTVGLCLSLCGCALSPLTRRTSAFAIAATVATNGTEDAYELVEQTYRDAQVARLVANYDDGGFDAASLQPFLTEPQLKIRVDVLRGLRSYADLLTDVGSDKSLTSVDASAKAMGASLQAISRNDLMQAKLTATDVNLATTAIDALGRALIERKRRRDLPSILRHMQEPIETICALLQQDIGDPVHSGLRNQLHINYLDLMREQKNYIADNEDKLTPDQRREEIRVLPRLAASEQRGDRALAATAKALAQVARTHTALAATASQKNAPAFNLQMQQLASSTQQLQSFYASLPSHN